VHYSRHNTVLDMLFDTALPRTMGHGSKLYEARYEVFLLPKHCYPSLALVPEPPIMLCFFFFRLDRSEGRGRKVRNIATEIFFEMCRNVEICFLKIQILKFR